MRPGAGRHLVVMLKEPRPGRVKTRLAIDMGRIAAARWFRAQALSLIRRLDDPRWRLILAVSPDREGLASRVWPARLPRVAQAQGDLGARMGRILRTLPPGPAVIVGADVPAIARSDIAAAFAALGYCPSVLGPAVDGGYWLIGLRRTQAVPADLFAGVRWSTDTALEDTARTLPDPVARLRTLRDVDTGADLARIAAEGGA